MNFGLEVVNVWSVKAILENIKNNSDKSKEELEKLCNSYIKYVDEIKFKAYE